MSCQGQASAERLDDPSKLTTPAGDGCLVTAYQGAGGGSIMHRSQTRRGTPRRTKADSGEDRAARNMRRYALSNKLCRMQTLTYRHPEFEWSRVQRDLKNLRVSIRSEVGSFPYVYVVGLHPGGHGLHVHILVNETVCELVENGWRQGHVNTKPLRSSREVRKAAHYLAHEFSSMPAGRHRYEVWQGFAPEKVSFLARCRKSAEKFLEELMGAPPSEVRLLGPGVWFGLVAWWDSWFSPDKVVHRTTHKALWRRRR